MIRLAQYLPTVLLLMGLALPFAGPLVDHHYADRQPGHKHLFAVGSHLHSVDSSHSHLGGDTGGDADGPSPATVYNYDSGLAAAQDVPRDASNLLAALQHEPSSVFKLPSPPLAAMMGQAISPPAKPPRPLS
jgi:hypothetical protein